MKKMRKRKDVIGKIAASAPKNNRMHDPEVRRKHKEIMNTPEIKEKCASAKPSKYWLGKKRSDETKKKLRLATIKQLEKLHGHIHPIYNPNACKIIDDYGEKHGYKFQHAENGGEFHIKKLGYWVDGYDRKKNVVIEYLEKHHNRPNNIIKDIKRKKEIINFLKCKFIEIKEEI